MSDLHTKHSRSYSVKFPASASASCFLICHLLIWLNGKRNKTHKIFLKKFDACCGDHRGTLGTWWRGCCRRLGREASSSPFCLPRSFLPCGFCWGRWLPQPCWYHCNCGQMWARTQGMWCWSGEAQPQAMLTKVKVICSPPAQHPVTRLSTVSSSLCPPPHLLPVSHHPAVPDSWKPEHSSEHRDVSLKKAFYFILEYSRLTSCGSFRGTAKGFSHTYTCHVSILSQTFLPSRMACNIEQSSMCYTVGPCWLSI